MTKLEEWVLPNGYRLEQHWIEGADNPRDDDEFKCRTRPTAHGSRHPPRRAARHVDDRRRNLAEEIMQRGILHRHSIAATARNWQDIDARLQFAVSYHGKAVTLDDLFVICINSAGSGSVYLGGQAVTDPWSP